MDSCGNWDYNAPTFVDFGNDDHEKSEGVEDYFNYDHESLQSASPSNNTEFGFKSADDQNNNDRQTFENVKAEIANISETLSCDRNATNVTTENSTSKTCATDLVTSDSGVVPKCNDAMEVVEPVEVVSQMPMDHGSKSHVDTTTNTLIHDNIESDLPVGDAANDNDKIGHDTQIEKLENSREESPVDNNMCEEIEMKSENNSPRVEDKSDVIPVMEEGSHEDMEITASKIADTPQRAKESPKSIVPSNIITPSRLALWERSSRQQRRSCVAAIFPKPKERRLKQLEELKEQRRSGRNVTPISNGPPPSKKKRSNKVVKLVAPITPTVLKHTRYSSVPKFKSSEEMELEQIQEMKFQAKQLAKESSKSFKRAIKTPPTNNTPIAHVKSTQVKEFKFQTDERMKSSHTMDTRSRKLSSEIDFTKGLRQHPPSPKKLKNTVVKPFHFSTTRKRKIETEINKAYDFVPMAKAVMNFQKGPRAQTSSTMDTRRGPMKAKPGLTVAKTPKLESKSRARVIHVVGAKEIEDKEVAEMKNYHFKAQPVNREILEHADTLPVVRKSVPTEAVGFDLKIDKRVEERPKHDDMAGVSSWEFKANPVPRKIFEGVVGVVKVESAVPTAPQSPAFALKNRMHIAQIRKENKENVEQELKAKEAAAIKHEQSVRKKTMKPKVVPVNKTEVKPFSFNNRDQERFAKKDEKIRSIIDSEKAIHSAFRATPICHLSDPVASLPPKHTRKSTAPKPFNLSSDDRGVARVEKWKQGVEDNVRALREKCDFKANTNYTKVIYGKAFKPIMEKKVTEFDEFSLHSTERATEREEFDERQKLKEADIQASKEILQREAEEMQREEIEKLRREAEHRANPIRKFKPVVVGKSTKELTTPQSPLFSDRFYQK